VQTQVPDHLFRRPFLLQDLDDLAAQRRKPGKQTILRSFGLILGSLLSGGGPLKRRPAPIRW